MDSSRSRFTNPLRVALAASLGAALLMVCERALLGRSEWLSYSFTTEWLLLPALLMCHWFPYALTTVLVVLGVARLVELGKSGTRRSHALVMLGLLLVPFGYGVALAFYTFSGPQAELAWYRPIGLVVLPFVLTLIVALPFLAVVRSTRGWRRPYLVLLITLGGLSLTVNQVVLPDEYEPLHVFLALTALLCFAGFGAIFVARWQPATSPRRGATLLGGALLLAFGGMLVIGHSHVLSYFVYSKAPGSRYVATRLDWDWASDNDGADQPELKPQLALDRKLAQKARAARAVQPAPHIIVVSIDNVQANRVGAYGYTRHPTTPNIDRLAARGMVFDQAYSWFPKTRMFLSSMLYGRMLPPFKDHPFVQRYGATSITHLLGERNYMVLLKGWFDASRHFSPDGLGVDLWMPPAAEDPRRRTRNQPYVSMPKNYKKIRKFFARARRRHRPVFAWMHFLRPHRVGASSFLADESRGFGSTKSDAYDSAIAVADAYLPKLEALARRYLERDRPVYWVVMADHGTGFFSTAEGDVRFDDGCNVADRFTRVPLIVAGPDITPGRSDVLVSSAIDTAATVLDLAGISPPESYDGVSLLPVLGGYLDGSAAERRAIFLNYYNWRGLVYQRHKLVVFRGGLSLVSLDQDPLEAHNMADEQRPLVRRLKALMEREGDEVAHRGG